MKANLQKKLLAKYPKILDLKEIPEGLNCVGNGWYKLIDIICFYIQTTIDKQKLKQVKAIQVKQKFGGLRFYVKTNSDEIYWMIRIMENMSFSICEDCGSVIDVITTDNLYVESLCRKCRFEKYPKKYRREIAQHKARRKLIQSRYRHRK